MIRARSDAMRCCATVVSLVRRHDGVGAVRQFDVGGRDALRNEVTHDTLRLVVAHCLPSPHAELQRHAVACCCADPFCASPPGGTSSPAANSSRTTGTAAPRADCRTSSPLERRCSRVNRQAGQRADDPWFLTRPRQAARRASRTDHPTSQALILSIPLVHTSSTAGAAEGRRTTYARSLGVLRPCAIPACSVVHTSTRSGATERA